MDIERLRFTESHEWVSVEGEEAIIGITDFAQSELNDIIYVELPEVGSMLSKGDVLTVLESVKAAEEVLSPLSGEVLAVNADLDGEPERINQDPFGDGWIIRIKLADPGETGALLAHDDYKSVLEAAK
jgi:glycine cleavage system H protein